MSKYYYIDSNGEDTNLQLYSLKQAKLYWSSLVNDVAEYGDEVEDFHERCVFVVCTMGLSVSQLLGQNNPTPSHRVPSPKAIFKSLVTKHEMQSDLVSKFEEFISTYDHCRHFGLTNNNERHSEVSQVTLQKTRDHYEFGMLVWDIVINIFRSDPKNELEDLNLLEIEN